MQIGIIGLPESSSTAREAIEKILGGSPHSTVYRFLEKKRREMKKARLLGEDLK